MPLIRRHSLNSRDRRLRLVARYAAVPEPARHRGPTPHPQASRPGEIVPVDCFYVGRLTGINGVVWHDTATDVVSAFTWAQLHTPPKNPSARWTSELAPPRRPVPHWPCHWAVTRVTRA